MKLNRCYSQAVEVAPSVGYEDLLLDFVYMNKLNEIAAEFSEMLSSFETYTEIIDTIKKQGGVTKSIEVMFGENFSSVASMEAEAEENASKANEGLWEKIKTWLSTAWEWIKNLFTSNEKIAAQLDELISKLQSGAVKPNFPITVKRPKYIQNQIEEATKPPTAEGGENQQQAPVKEAEDFVIKDVQGAVNECKFVKDALEKIKTIGDGVKNLEEEYKAKEGNDPGFFKKASMYMKTWATKQFVMSATRAYATRLQKLLAGEVQQGEPGVINNGNQQITWNDATKQFTDKKIIDEIKANPDLSPALLKQKNGETFTIVTAIVNKKTNDVVRQLKSLKGSKLDPQLEQKFGDKDLIVINITDFGDGKAGGNAGQTSQNPEQKPAENKPAEQAKPNEGQKQEGQSAAAPAEAQKPAEQKAEAQPKQEEKGKAESKDDYIKMCGETANSLVDTCKKRLTKLDAIMKTSKVDDSVKLNPAKAQEVMSDEDFQYKNISLKRLVTLGDIKFNISKVEKAATHALDVVTGDTSKMTDKEVKAIYADVLSYQSYVSALFKLATSTANIKSPGNKTDVNSTQVETTEDGSMNPTEAKKIAENKEKPVNPGATQVKETEDGAMDPNEVKAATVKAEDILKNRIGNLSSVNTQIGDNLKSLNATTSDTRWPDSTPLKSTKALKVPGVLTGGKTNVTFEPKTIGELKSKLKEVSERIASFTANAEKNFKQNTVNNSKENILAEAKKDSEGLSTFARELIALSRTCIANCKANPNKQSIGSKIKEGASKIVQKIASPFTSTKARATASGEYSFEGFSLEDLVKYNQQLTDLIVNDVYDADIVSYTSTSVRYSNESLSDEEFWQ